MDGIRVIAYREGENWVAQCLEVDIGAQASDLNELYTRLILTLEAELQHSLDDNVPPFDGIGPAPARFLALWDKRSGSFKPVNPVSAGADGDVEVELALCA